MHLAQGLSPQDQQTISDFLKWMALVIPALGGVIGAFWLAISKAYYDSKKLYDAQNAEHSKKQAEAMQDQAAQTKTTLNELTPVLNKMSEAMLQMSEDRTQIAVLKTAMDQREPLDSIIRQNGEFIEKASHTLEMVGSTLLSAMREMRGGKADIIAEVTDHFDKTVTPLSAMTNGILQDVTGNRDKLIALDQKVVDHNAMTEEKLRELLAEIEGLGSRFEEALGELKARHTRELQARQDALDAANARIADLITQLTDINKALPENAEKTPQTEMGK